MPDPADKSDDLIAELAKLMAAPTGKPSAVQPPARPAPLNLTPMPTTPATAAPTPTPVRIPGMDAAPAKPAAQAPTPAPTPVADTRAPATGTIRIPGMDQPAPVSTSAPVGKFDFGKPVAAAALRQEPLSTLSERLAAQNPSAAPAAPRIPSSLTPVSENRSFAEGPALSVAKPAPTSPAASSGDFSFDFGFAQNPPNSSTAPQPMPQPQAAPPVHSDDPIADLIEADMVDHVDATEGQTAPEEAAPHPAPVAPPMLRAVTAQPAQARPSISPANSAPTRPAGNSPIPLKPVSVAPRPPESDRFAISPGVGLNMKPPASQPLGAPVSRGPQPPAAHDDDDPMSEIESLIGEAVRVELSPGPVRVQAPQSVSPKVELEAEDDVEAEIAHHPQAAPAPVVPPLTTQFAPRRANLKDDAASRSAEDAILAAAAASGSNVGRMEPSVGGESPYRRLKVKPERSAFFSGGLRQYIGMAVAGTLLLAAGLGLYWVLNMGRSGQTGANAPVLTADATPAKVLPSAAPSAPTDAAKSPVLAKMDGATPAPSSEQLVSTEQSTADVTNDVAPATGGDNESGLANRKVRTVTVRPDGTIVSGDDAVAGGEALPIDRPNVPAVPSTETTNLLGNGDQGASPTPLVPSALDATAGPDNSASGPTTQTADVSPVIDTTQVAPTPMQFPVRSSTAAKTGGSVPTNTTVNALVPKTTPQELDLMGGGNTTPAQKPVQVAATKPVQATPAAPAGGSAAAYVQLSSQPSAADAQASVKSMTSKYGSLFGGSTLVVQQVDLGQKGVRWRVRLPTDSLSAAASICAQIKAQGGDCFATNG